MSVVQFNCIKQKGGEEMAIKISMEAARVNAGLTQKQFAERCGVSESTVINWERGKNAPHIKRLPMIEKAYGIPLDNVKIPY